MSKNDSYELGYATADGQTVDKDVLYIGLDVPAGRRAHVVARVLTLTENSYTVDVITAENGFTGGMLGYKSPLDEGDVASVQSNVYFDVTPDGAETVRFSNILEAGNQPGSARNAGALLNDDYATSWVSSPMIKITRAQGGSPYSVSLRAIVYEEVEP